VISTDHIVVHQLTPSVDLKPENLLYLNRDPESDLVLADFGIAKMLDGKGESLKTMAGSFGYADLRESASADME